MSKFLLLFISLVSISYFPNQPIDNLSTFTDKVIIHLNQSFYVNGDRIWYKIYLPSTYKSIDIPIKVALIGKSGVPIQEGYVNTSGNTFIDGQIKIPLDLPSDTYHLVAYGIHNQTKEFLKIAEVFIPIYNDLQKDLDLGNQLNDTLSIPPKKQLVEESLNLSIKINKEDISKRQKISATIVVTDKDGQPIEANLSIAVRDVSLMETAITNGQTVWVVPSDVATFAHVLNTSILITGKVQVVESTIKNLPILSAYSNINKEFYYTKTDQGGNFSLSLADFKHAKTLQFTNYEEGKIQIQLTKELPISQSPPLLVNEGIINYLEWSSKRKKLLQLFKTSETVFPKNITAEQTKVLIPDRQFILAEYEHFNSLYDLCKEVSSPLKFRKTKEGRIYAKMFNPAQRVRKFYTASPIFIIDGKVTKDPEFVNQLDMNQVEQIDLYFEREKLERTFGPMGFGGVVFIKTLIPNIQIPTSESNTIFTIQGLYPKMIHTPPNTDNQNTDNVPIFKSYQYWSANQITNSQGQVGFSFNQSDDLGIFEIEVVAQDSTGSIGIAKTTYFVE